MRSLKDLEVTEETSYRFMTRKKLNEVLQGESMARREEDLVNVKAKGVLV